jgi:quercetin dioxygenase-like cupin family protein
MRSDRFTALGITSSVGRYSMVTRLVKVLSYVLTLAVAFGIGTAVGQQAPPKENKGVTTEKTAKQDLANEIEGMKGWHLRLRVLNIEPGGVVGLHSHKDRPSVAYVVQGTMTEHREGGATKEHAKGDAWSEGKETTHWSQNKGQTPVVLIVADIFKP